MSVALAKTYSLPTQHIKSYLEREHWSLVNENDRWIVFQSDHPVDIALPKDTLAPDYHVYVEHALKTLSSASGQPLDTIVNAILRYDRTKYDLDILRARLMAHVYRSSLALRVATNFIAGLRLFLISATDPEVRDPKPWYEKAGSNPGDVLDEIQFGHTFASSFGFSIESPVKTPTNMFEPPLQRRVMQRIARGMIATEKAVMMENESPLVEGYETGFNANMCDAILSMSDDYDMEMVYTIEWSQKYPVADDLKAVSSVSISRDHFELLKVASAQLKNIKPEFVTVEGHIVSLRSPHNPQSEDADERRVTVAWEMENAKSRKIVVPLERDEYLEAISAHKDNKRLSVKGYIRSSDRQLAEPSDFKIIG